MRTVIAGLIVLFVLLQYKLWVADDGLPEVWRLKQKVDAQSKKTLALEKRNAALDAETKGLKRGDKALEEQARTELGMIKKGEVFYQYVQDSHNRVH